MKIKDAVHGNKQVLFEVLRQLVSFNSIYKPNENNTPFGLENRNCLRKALSIAESFKLRTKNLNDYCGYIEIGSGEQIVGIVAHLDIVPAGVGWESNPFILTEKAGYLYGRGTSDDKGAASASILALKIIKDLNIDLNNKKVRLVLGCNEETGSNCMRYYNSLEPPFLYAFTPDGDFPCINGEKGQINCSFKCNKTSLLELKGGNVRNAVSNICRIMIKSKDYNKEKFIAFLIKNNLKVEIKTYKEIDNITVIGKSAHASTPELGINAITYTMHA